MSGPYSHTPGPFELSNGMRVYAPGKAGALLATVHDLPRAPGQSAANATLFAAAPRMLAALRKARDCILIDRTALADCAMRPDGSIEEDQQPAIAEYDEVLAEIDAAIAEAEGAQ